MSLKLINQAVEDLRARSEGIMVHRAQFLIIVRRCEELSAKLREKERALGESKFEEAVVDFERSLLKIRDETRKWGKYSRAKYFVWHGRVTNDLGTFNELLDTHVRRFKTITDSELSHQRSLSEMARQEDQEELIDMMYDIIRSKDDLERFARDATQDGVRALMQVIQEELQQDIDIDAEDRQALQRGLGRLEQIVWSQILTELEVTGQVTSIREAPMPRGAAIRICEGRWMGSIKVMLKAIRYTGDHSKKWLDREMSCWRLMEHGNLVRFYGTCTVGPKVFIVSAILSEAALGLKYLHTFQPAVVHGGLRAANVLISTTGKAMLSGFGWRKTMPDEDNITSASENAGSTRWMSAELLQVGSDLSSSLTPECDVWSFGMLCLEVLTGQIPFYPTFQDDDEVALALRDGVLPARPEPRFDFYKRGLSDEMWSLMMRCWAHQPAIRLEMRFLAMDVRELHMEHMRRYRVPSIGDVTKGIAQTIISPDESPCNLTITDLPTPPESIRTASPPVSPAGRPDRLPPLITNNIHGSNGAISRTSVISSHCEGNERHSEEINQLTSLPSATQFWHNPGVAEGFVSNNALLRPMANQSFPAYGSLSSIEAPLDAVPTVEYDELGNVLRGNLEGLVRRSLVDTHGNYTQTIDRSLFTDFIPLAARTDSEFREYFLTTYRGFATTENLWRSLVYQYHALTLDQPRDSQTRQKRVLALLKDWLDIQYIQPRDRNVLLSIQDFIRENQWDVEGFEAARNNLETKIEGHLTTLASSSPQLVNRSADEEFNLDSGNPWAVAAISEQLVRTQSDLFQKILASECASWAAGVSEQELPNMRRFIQSNDWIRDWCLSKVLGPNESEQRAHMVTFFIRVMSRCLAIRGFSSADAILSALDHPCVRSLPKTWKYVKRSQKNNVKRAAHLLNPSSANNSTHKRRTLFLARRLIKNTRFSEDYTSMLTSSPGMPCIPLLKKLLEEISEQHRRTGVNGSIIDFQHFTKICGKAKELVAYQAPHFHVACEQIPGTYRYLKRELETVEANVNLCSQLQVRSEEIASLEKIDDKYRQTELSAAGF